ncbi:UNVERIFIED_CONTAM: hypothetical protein GTU68_020692 [Idotea baltica]|nr:hypothetical protein [Idotea baltica]
MTYWVSSLLFPMAVSVLLSMISTVFLTGAFHEDGLADTADGFGGGWDKAQVLAIMKDSRVGAYGVIALILILGLKFSILIELANESSERVVLALFCGHAVSRLMALMPMQYYEYVSERETSKSHTVASMKLGGYELLFSTIPVVGLLIVSWQVGFILAVMAAIAVTVLLSRYFKVRIGGYTGDCLGSIQQLSELMFYLILLA